MTLDDFSLSDLVPDSIAGDANVSASIASADVLLHACAADRDVPALFSRFENLSSGQLDHLAVQFDAPTWSDSWSVELKRSVLRSIIDIKRTQGTLHAVREALSSIGAGCRVTEWWQTSPKGTPHTFSVDVMLSGFDEVTTETQELVQILINAAKPVRSQYTFNISTALSGGKGAESVMRHAVETRFSNF